MITAQAGRQAGRKAPSAFHSFILPPCFPYLPPLTTFVPPWMISSERPSPPPLPLLSPRTDLGPLILQLLYVDLVKVREEVGPKRHVDRLQAGDVDCARGDSVCEL